MRVVGVLQGEWSCLLAIYALTAGGITAALLVFAHRLIAATEIVHHGYACSRGKNRVHLTGRSHGTGFESGKILTVQTPSHLFRRIPSIEARQIKCCKRCGKYS